MKKIISILIAALLAVSSMGVVLADGNRVFTTDISSVSEVQAFTGLISVLSGGKMVIEEEDLSHNMTRREFAEFLAVLMNKHNTDTNSIYFEDARNIMTVNVMAEAGIFKGGGDSLFEPDRYVTASEVYISFIRALGYESHTIMYGDDTYGYMSLANRIKLCSNIGGFDTTITKQMVIEIALRACDIYMPRVNAVVVGEPGYVTFSDTHEDTLLWVYHKINKVEGVVTANSLTSLYDAHEMPDDYLEIGNVRYSAKQPEAKDLIGRYVTAYCRTNENQEGPSEIVYIASIDSENESIVVELEDVISYDDNTLKYYDGKKERIIKMSPSVALIYNGKASDTDFRSQIAGAEGYLKYYKTKAKDVMIVERYENVTVTLVDYATYTIYTDSKKPEYQKMVLNRADGINYDIYNSVTGFKTDVLQQNLGTLLSVAMSDDGKYTKIYSCTGVVTGVLSSTERTSGCTTIIIDGEEYELAYGFELPTLAKIGAVISCKLDAMGKVAAISADRRLTNEVVAYLKDVAYKNYSFDDYAAILVFTEDGEHLTLKLAEKVNFDSGKITRKKACEALRNSKGEVVNQLIRYRLNKDEEVVLLDTAPLSVDKIDVYGSLYEITSGKYEEARFSAAQQMLVPRYPLRKQTKIFMVPTAGTTDYDNTDFSVLDWTAYEPFVSTGTNKVRCYKTDASSPFADYVLYDYSARTAALDLVVEEINAELGSEGEIQYVAEGMVHGYDTKLYFDKDVSVAGIENGDIIEYMTNPAGEIAKWSMQIDYNGGADGEPRPGWYDSEESFVKYNHVGAFFGTVMDIKKDPSNQNQIALGIGFQGEIVDWLLLGTNTNIVMVYDSSLRNDRISVGTLADVFTSEIYREDEKPVYIYVSKNSQYFIDVLIYK